MQNAGFRHLLPDSQRWIEGRGGALCKVSNALTPQTTQLIRIHGYDIFTIQAHFAAHKLKAGFGVT